MNLSRATLIAALGVFSLGFAAGCAPSLSGMQPAHVAPKGHFEATAAVEVGIPTGTIGEIIDTGRPGRCSRSPSPRTSRSWRSTISRAGRSTSPC